MRRNKDSGLQFQKHSPLATTLLSFLVVCSFLALISNKYWYYFFFKNIVVPIKITANFSTETLKARRAWSEVFQALNENKFNLGYSTQ
jgi:hypothetical protein